MKNSNIYISLLLIPAFLLIFFVCLCQGTIYINLSTVWSALSNYDPENKIHYIIVNMRLPRLIQAFSTGGILALCGYLLQSWIGNPLAEPYLLGTSSGASLGVNLVFLGFLPVSIGSAYITPLAGFAGAFLSTLFVISISIQKQKIIPGVLILAGVAISAFLTALLNFLIYMKGSDVKLKSLVYWAFGGFENASWKYIPLTLLSLFSAVILFYAFHKEIHLLILGEERAQNLGLKTKNIRRIILISVAFLTSVSVASSGPVGFVGLIIPHVVRVLYGNINRFNIIYCVLWGGFFILFCDVISRVIFSPSGLPIGIVTSFFGAPFFIYLLVRKSSSF
ncbi:MAG: hypothetical protein A3H98_11695 [Bacteroidetes bacterium RIFCSPLOWO2_02_FULL_36_8]|nr:MAG: hypothetical protein A3H98_11695 [Bacteroidetes bacterium RIFCSPLOWO2_02_FULL_36_8]OFY71539.1 MAG: hypothetical protein A3G23_04650 [Bacteroidetes bacterium RIFCSPLOWO2_12_FULL_37_12]